MITPVVAVVGYSDSGKTRVASSLISMLTERGYRIAAVKHCPHGHDTVPANRDTDRLYAAGATAVVASSPDRLTKVERVAGDSSLEQVVSAMGIGIDLVVAEGFKSCAFPKVLVANGWGRQPIPEDVIAIITDQPGSSELPTYGTGELNKLADQIGRQFLSVPSGRSAVSLVVDGVRIPLKEFPADALSGIVMGFVHSLDRVPDNPAKIEVTVIDNPTRDLA
jgi:molybdopterin-guanine dinucleotide biosynthesis protein MobB